MEETCSRRERNVIVYDFKEFSTEQEAVKHARKINRWKMPAGQKKIFKISREICYPEILNVEKFVLAFNLDECEGDLREIIESAKKLRSFLEGRTKIFRVDMDMTWPEGEDLVFREAEKKITV